MLPKLEKLNQRLQEIQKLVAPKVDRNEMMQTVFQELENIAERLKTEKLTLQIISTNLFSGQALQNFINLSEKLLNSYEIKVNFLPSQEQQSKQNLSVALLLLAAPEQSQTRYELSPVQEFTIGRNPDCEIALEAGLYKKISWNHAKVKTLANPDTNLTTQNWEICDLNSTNGTYVNDTRIQGCQTLQPGDRITLAAHSTNSASPEFIFEQESFASIIEAEKSYKQLVNCDVLCLVVDANYPLSANEKTLIMRASEAAIAIRFVIIDVSNITNKSDKLIKSNLNDIETWLQNQGNSSSLELTFLALHPYYQNPQITEVDAQFQEKLAKFSKSLESLTNRKSEDILLQRFTIQVLDQIILIEQVFDIQVQGLNQEIQSLENQLQQLSKIDLKEQIKKNIKKVSEDRDKTFKQVKVELNQSKTTLLDSFSKKSIFSKIQLIVDSFKPVIVKKDSYTYVKLRSEIKNKTGNINIDLINFCSLTLEQWANEEWGRISTCYGEGGLNRLAQSSYAILNFIPDVNLENSLFNSQQHVDIQKSLLNSFIEVNCESRYREVSPVEYVVKQIRANMMQLTFIITLGAIFIGSKVGGGKQLILSITEPLRDNSWLFGIVLFTLICLTTYSYQKENSLKIEEIGDKLKKDLSNHYQSLAKNLVERLVQDFNAMLEIEERCIKENLEYINDRFMAYIIDIEKKQLVIKNSIEQNKLNQKNLEKEKVEFQKLKPKQIQ
ncbi:FHA domain-containing protein [Nostoc sphaeroides]|uniref:Forkhead-associated protein n=1 Tax=Nostoc sphaeroides CCNUC1 TaxID=2653204 RepID=A0A5P8WH32_9NOSO|nr:FHA domain-containing protein [Nostoc sphaeroides]QFS51129.1 forkhead-associated protein [Nostoc sphaeroides CCNUC1]